MSAAQIVLLVLAILGVQVLIWVPLLLWMRRRSMALIDALRAELAASGERVVRAPEPASYRGASSGRTKVKGNGVIALTERRVLFRKLVGDPLEVPLDSVAGVREASWFLGAYRNGRPHLILRLRDGSEIGFMVADHPGWMAAMQGKVP